MLMACKKDDVTKDFGRENKYKVENIGDSILIMTEDFKEIIDYQYIVMKADGNGTILYNNMSGENYLINGWQIPFDYHLKAVDLPVSKEGYICYTFIRGTICPSTFNNGKVYSQNFARLRLIKHIK